MQLVVDSLPQFMACCGRLVSVLFFAFVFIVCRAALAADAVV